MADVMKCWKVTEDCADAEQAVMQIGADTYMLQDATAEEIEKGALCLREWGVELLYEVMVSGAGVERPYLDRKAKAESVPFDELIFRDGECIGIYHAACAMLFDDESTHFQKKWLGEFITGPDRTHDAYDYYRLIRL